MPDKERILMMTRLAQYDRRYAREDLKKGRYFRHDYIYKRNAAGRFWVFVGCALILLLYEANGVFNGGVDLLAMDYRAELVKAGLFIIGAMVLYTCIGTVLYTREYHAAAKRLEWYYETLERLDERGARARRKQVAEREQYRTRMRLNNDGDYEAYGDDDADDDDTPGVPPAGKKV